MWDIGKFLNKYFGSTPAPWTGPICKYCGKPITDFVHKDKQYCDDKCGKRARREREKKDA
jgi:hypothetical protein